MKEPNSKQMTKKMTKQMTRKMTPKMSELDFAAGFSSAIDAAIQEQNDTADKRLPHNNKVYLGDSVYAEFTGSMVTLTTDNGEGPTNTIHLEPIVIRALNEYFERQRLVTRTPKNGGENGNKISVAELIQRLGGAARVSIRMGNTPSAVSKWITGERNPTPLAKRTMCRWAGIASLLDVIWN